MCLGNTGSVVKCLDMGARGSILHYTFLTQNGFNGFHNSLQGSQNKGFFPDLYFAPTFKGKSVGRGKDTNSGKCSKTFDNMEVIKAVWKKKIQANYSLKHSCLYVIVNAS